MLVLALALAAAVSASTLDDATAALKAENDRFALESSGEAAMAARNPQDTELVRRVLARAEAHRRKTLPLKLFIAVEAEKRAGNPPDAARVARLRRFLEEPWKVSTPDPEGPALDLLALDKQLRRWWGEDKKPALLVKKALPPPPAAPLFVKDAGRGRVRADPVPALLAQLAAPEAKARALAAEELGALRAGSALPKLREALKDKDARVRASAALAIGSIGIATPEVLADLQLGLFDASEEVRVDTRTALGLLSRR